MKRSLVFKTILATALALSIAPFTAGSASAADPTTHIILIYPGATGESAFTGYRSQIDITSLKWGTSRASGSVLDPSALTSGKLAINEITLTKKVDASSTQLLNEHFLGRTAASVTIDFTSKPRGALTDMVYMRYLLSSASVSGYSVSTTDTGVAIETITLSFAKIVIEYVEMVPTSTVPTAKPKRSAGYDLVRQAIA